ncbi:MAG: hypothetical protein ABR947_10850 [Solirubrobacteraceae bacterium]|jgi:hypothetical protein
MTIPSWTRRAAVAGLALMAIGAPVALAAIPTITRAHALAVADAISLRHSDLPTLTQEPNPITAQDQQGTAALTKCAGGVPDSEAFANTQSDNFVSTNQSLTISSGTEILPTTALVAKDFAAIERPHALTCVLDLLGATLRASLPKTDRATSTIARIPSVVPSIAESEAIRLEIVVHVPKGKSTVDVPIYSDVIGFAYGQAEISMNVQQTLTPPSASLERRLAALLLARAQAAIG